MAPSSSTIARAVDSRCIGQIPRHDRISVRDFVHEYFLPRKPVILSRLTDGWRAREKWSFEFFRETYGDVPVICGRCFDKTVRQSFADYIDYVESYEPISIDDRGPRAPIAMEGWYFRYSNPELMDDYRIPEVFSNDWWKKPAFKRWDPKASTILISAKGAFTKLHYDLLCLNTWNTQIRGSKRWLLASPEHTRDVYIETRQSPGYFPGTDIDAPDLERYPRLANIRYTEGILHAGETIFFPRGWLHQVVTLEKSISLSHHYMSSNNCVAVMSAYVQGRLGRRNI
jgi:hypothetical protein